MFHSETRAKLEKGRAELLLRITDLREGLKLDLTLSPEDQEQRAADASQAADGIDGASKALRLHEEALSRLHDGSYGTCTICGGGISTARLSALPFTPHCIRCAEREEKKSSRQVSNEGRVHWG